MLNVFLVHDISYIFVLEGTLYYITDVCFACLPFSFDLTNRELDKMRDFLLNISNAQVIDLSSYFFPSITIYWTIYLSIKLKCSYYIDKSNSRKSTEQNMSYNWSYLSCKVVMICSRHQHGTCILFDLRNMGVRRKSPQTSSLKKYVENNYKRKWVINVVMWSFMVISFHA